MVRCLFQIGAQFLEKPKRGREVIRGVPGVPPTHVVIIGY